MITTEKNKKLNKISELSLQCYRKLYLIRKSEEKIISHYFEDQMKTPMHMSMGAEAIAVGICQALKPDDQVFGTYRSHALFLAKTEDTDDFFAEMYGKQTASLKGKGGSMHLCAPDYGFMGTSAIVASAIPVAVGAAFANKRAKNNRIVAVFFGDGAVEEGVFWESLNLASLMKLPILFVCEDNGLAVHTPKSQRRGYESIIDVVSNFNCLTYEDKTTDVEMIHQLASKAIGRIRTEMLPCFLRLQYFRYLEHVGVNQDFDAAYRSKDNFDEWLKVDPIELQRKKLKDLGMEEDVIKNMEMDIDSKIDNSIAKAKEAGFSGTSELYQGVLA
ncbi:MAG: thiamine pyrophosphate-dependent dehydrogenase E1 component subunit alpha [Phycisphaerales bacterium]